MIKTRLLAELFKRVTAIYVIIKLMKNILLKINIIFILSIFIFPLNFVEAKVETGGEQENIFYYFSNVNGYSDFKKNYKKIDVLAPQVYTVKADLKVKSPSDNRILKYAKRKKVNTMPLLVQDYFDKVLMSNILLDQKAQDEIIDFMIKEAKEYDFIGWQFDFENINHLDRDMYTDFVTKTHKKLSENNLKFSVAVVVRSKDYNPNSTTQDWSSAYDYNALAENSDFLSLMTYDEPYSSGPVASIPYVEKTLKYILTQAPAEKLSLGIPLYCWHWQNGKRIGSTTYELTSKMFRKGKERSIKFDETFGAEYNRFTKDGIENIIWCDGKKGIEMKKDLVEKYGLRGFSLWALGQGDKNIWALF